MEVIKVGKPKKVKRAQTCQGNTQVCQGHWRGAGSLEVIKVGKPKKVKKAVWREALGVRRPFGFQFALFHFLSVLASINDVFNLIQ